MQPSMDVCSWIHQAQDRSWRPYVMRTPNAAMRTSPSHVYYRVTTLGRFSRDGDFDRRRGLCIKAVQPQDARSIKFFQDLPLQCPEHVGATTTIFVAANRNQPQPLPRGLRTAVATTTSRPPSRLKQGRKCQRQRGLCRSSKDLNQRSCPDYPVRRGD
jgi:hypothetical protein